MSDRSVTRSSTRGVSSGNVKSRSGKVKKSSSSNVRRRRGGKSRTSYQSGSRSRFNQRDSSTASAKTNYHKVIFNGTDVTPTSLLPLLPQADDSAEIPASKTTAPVTSSLQQRQQSDASMQTGDANQGATLQVSPPDSNQHGSSRPTNANLTPAALERDVVITLSETNTIELLNIRGYVVHQESEQQRIVTAQNDQYKELLRKRHNKDLFSSAAAQTFNPSVKSKKIQTEPPVMRDAEVTATNWGIYDSQNTTFDADEWNQPGSKDEDIVLSQEVQDLVTMFVLTNTNAKNTFNAVSNDVFLCYVA